MITCDIKGITYDLHLKIKDFICATTRKMIKSLNSGSLKITLTVPLKVYL